MVTGGAKAAGKPLPKLLLRNAALFAGRPAMRQKDLGIWQTWTWADVLDEVRAFAVGLHEIGLKRGDTIAIVGDNRPRLYWSMCAAQALGAMPVPVYPDFGRRRDGLCARACRSRALRWSKTRSRSTSCWRSPRPVKGIATSSMTKPAACAITTTAPALASRRCRSWAVTRLAADPARTGGSTRSPRAGPTIPPSSSIPRAPPAARRA